VDLLVTLRTRNLEPKRLQWVYPRKEEEAKFVLTEALKTRGIELKILPPLFLDGLKLPPVTSCRRPAPKMKCRKNTLTIQNE